MITTDTMCSCGTRGCARMIDPDVDEVSPQIFEQLEALETERATAEMNAERLDDADEGWGDGQRERVAKLTAEIDKLMSDNHLLDPYAVEY